MSALHPPLRPFARPDVPAATGKESAAFDRHAIEELGVPQPVLMENAGRSTAVLIARLYPEGPVVALVGAAFVATLFMKPKYTIRWSTLRVDPLDTPSGIHVSVSPKLGVFGELFGQGALSDGEVTMMNST